MAAPIVSKATLITAVADHLNRSDLSAAGGAIEVALQLAEQRFQRDPRVREPGSNNTVLPSLFATDPNWLLTAEPDVYFYGVLVEMQAHVRDDERIALYEQTLQDRIDSLSGSVRLDPNRTLAIATYANLQTLVADALNRGDLKNIIPVLIKMFEAKASRDHRVKNLDQVTYSITGDGIAAPSGFRYAEEFYLDGSSWYGSIETVAASQLSVIKGRMGPTGVPRAVAFVDGTFYFGPAPDQTYSAKLVYWRTVTALAAGVNWLYTNHPDIYLWGTLSQAGPWVVGDQRAMAIVDEAKLQLEAALEELNLHVWNEQWGGDIVRQISPIG